VPQMGDTGTLRLALNYPPGISLRCAGFVNGMPVDQQKLCLLSTTILPKIRRKAPKAVRSTTGVRRFRAPTPARHEECSTMGKA
jgi:hypothetical protein